MEASSIIKIFSKTFHSWRRHNAPQVGAALTFYAVFSVVPLLVILIAIAGNIWETGEVQGQFAMSLRDAAGDRVAQTILYILNTSQGGNEAASIVGAVLLLYGGSSFFHHLRGALNKILGVVEQTKSGLVKYIESRIYALILSMGAGVLMVLFLIGSALTSAAAHYLGSGQLALNGGLVQVIEVFISFAATTVVLALMYRFVPASPPSWRNSWAGAIITALLFIIGKTALSIYLSHSSINSVYGVAGSFMVVLVWFYYSAQIVLFGAEFTKIYSNRRQMSA